MHVYVYSYSTGTNNDTRAVTIYKLLSDFHSYHLAKKLFIETISFNTIFLVL